MQNETANQLYCPGCGYDLRSIESDRCPECGVEIDRSTLGQSVIPWLHRTRLGRVRAFRKTARLATFRPRELAREIAAPAQFAQAKIFRRLVVLLAIVPLGIFATGGYVVALIASNSMLWSANDRLGSILQWAFVPMIWICLAAFLLAVTGAASYFFHPRSIPIVQQNRAIAISYYACAPLAYTPVSLLILGVGFTLGAVQMGDRAANVLTAILFITALIPMGAELFLALRIPVVLLRETTQCSIARQWSLAIFLMLFWCMAAFVLLVVLPMAAATLGLMLVSLRRS